MEIMESDSNWIQMENIKNIVEIVAIRYIGTRYLFDAFSYPSVLQGVQLNTNHPPSIWCLQESLRRAHVHWEFGNHKQIC